MPRAPLFVLVLGVFGVIYLLVAVLTTKHVRKLNAAEAAMQSKQTGYLADSITNVLAIKSFATDDREVDRFKGVTKDSYTALINNMKATIKRDAMFSTVGFASGFAALLSAIASVLLFHADIATVFLIFNYTSNVTRGLWDFSTSGLRQYNRALGDAADMVEILAIQPEVKDLPNAKPAKIQEGAIDFKHVKFAHPGAGETLFADLDLRIKPGEKIGLVGHSGSGKTTLTKLLLRFVDIDAGEILIDGQNIAKVTQNELRDHIAYVPQEPLLFHRSIRENIAYGRPEASETDIVEAAKKAHAAQFIAKLPQGYETLVGERGVKLSGGQRQRIAIARAILKNAPVLVLDEATSALDSESEKLIQAALWELMQKRTAIVVAHRLSTIQRMDRIVVLDDGNVIEQGTHKDLIAKKGVYAQLWAHQSGGFIEN
jgi:ATP-binding cassette subfamily B protein